MGHVDLAKPLALDYIRSTKVASQRAALPNIGAYR